MFVYVSHAADAGSLCCVTGLYPVYDAPRMVAGEFVGVKVAQHEKYLAETGKSCKRTEHIQEQVPLITDFNKSVCVCFYGTCTGSLWGDKFVSLLRGEPISKPHTLIVGSV